MTATTRGVGWISNAEKLLAQQLLRRLIYPKFPPLALRRLWQTDMIRDYCLYEAYLNLRLKTLNKSRNVGEILALIYVALYSVIIDQHISHIFFETSSYIFSIHSDFRRPSFDRVSSTSAPSRRAFRIRIPARSDVWTDCRPNLAPFSENFGIWKIPMCNQPSANLTAKASHAIHAMSMPW